MEILTVTAILAVLAAILFPVLGQAREWGRRVDCLSNLRQIGVAVGLYQADHGGDLPIRNLVFAHDPGFSQEEANPLAPYKLRGQVLRCDRCTLQSSYAGDVRVSDYSTRFVFDLIWKPRWFRLEPTPTSAIAWDGNHVSSGDMLGAGETWMVLRADFSVDTALGPEILQSQPITGTMSWTPPSREGKVDALQNELVFPRETWPPNLTPIAP